MALVGPPHFCVAFRHVPSLTCFPLPKTNVGRTGISFTEYDVDIDGAVHTRDVLVRLIFTGSWSARRFTLRGAAWSQRQVGVPGLRSELGRRLQCPEGEGLHGAGGGIRMLNTDKEANKAGKSGCKVTKEPRVLRASRTGLLTDTR